MLCNVCRLKDVLFLDIALDLACQTALASSLQHLRSAMSYALLGGLIALVLPALENACLSLMPGGANANLELVMCFKLLKKLATCPG